jgi:glycosyltransferase involved in cell wall biosynthesis
MRDSKPRILIFCDYYPPGHESSGGMRTIINTVERLRDEFDFWIVTRYYKQIDYKELRINDWNEFGKVKTFYISVISPCKLRHLIKFVLPSSIYSNSFFSTFTVNLVLLRKFGLISDRIPLIIAPEGELSEGALSLKRRKKALYLQFAQVLKLYKGVIWKAASEMEKVEIERFGGGSGSIFVAPNMPPKDIFPEFDVKLKPTKKKGEVRLAFLSRIHPTKNLKFLLKLLKKSEGVIILDVYGPREDKKYFEECLKIVENLSRNAKVGFKGEVNNKDVTMTLLNYHFFVLPTLGESFGHVIVEALAAGCPLIISDTTPWQRLEEKGIGWDIPLDDVGRWREILNLCLNMDDVTYRKMSLNARRFIEAWLRNNEIEDATRKVLLYSLEIASK